MFDKKYARHRKLFSVASIILYQIFLQKVWGQRPLDLPLICDEDIWFILSHEETTIYVFMCAGWREYHSSLWMNGITDE
jgi:hypothetical protein